MSRIISILWVDDEPDIQTGFIEECKENNINLIPRKSYNLQKNRRKTSFI